MTYQPFTSANEEASSLVRGLAADMFSRADRETSPRMAGNRMEVGHVLVEAADWLEARTQPVENPGDHAGQPLPPEIWPGAQPETLAERQRKESR